MSERTHVYGEFVRAFDETATAADMRYCTEQFRDNYRGAEVGSPVYLKYVQDAAYCESVAERKEGQRPR